MLRRQFVDVMDRAFMPRELFLRADGRVRYVKVSRRQQMAAAAIVTGFAGWTLASTAGLVAGGFVLSHQSTQRHEAELAYAQLRAQVAASRARFAEMATALSSQQRFLLDLVNGRSSANATPAAGAGSAASGDRRRSGAADAGGDGGQSRDDQRRTTGRSGSNWRPSRVTSARSMRRASAPPRHATATPSPCGRPRPSWRCSISRSLRSPTP